MYSGMRIAFAVLLVMSAVKADSRFTFGYDGEEGPDHWADHFQACAGKYQSPINIEEHLVQTVRLLPLEFKGFDVLPATSTLTNNGHTVMLELNTTQTAYVSGGPLKGNYIFAQLHFHWGNNDSFGSEDLINNQSYPMELHVVTYKSTYGDSGEAGNHKDGLTVLAFFFEVIDTDNKVYAEIVDSLENVREPDSNARLSHQISLDSLIGSDRKKYYTYHGSLTTPPCSEVVTWLDFVEPILLSHAQLESFRTLRTYSGLMTHNNRPTQPVGSRLVWYNEAEQSSATAIHHTYTIITIIVTLLVINI